MAKRKHVFALRDELVQPLVTEAVKNVRSISAQVNWILFTYLSQQGYDVKSEDLSLWKKIHAEDKPKEKQE